MDGLHTFLSFVKYNIQYMTTNKTGQGSGAGEACEIAILRNSGHIIS